MFCWHPNIFAFNDTEEYRATNELKQNIQLIIKVNNYY